MTASLAHHAPWTDRRGTLSPLRLVVFVAILVPGIAIFADLFFGPVRPEPYEHALNESGEWAVRLLLLSLFVTPVRRIFSWNKVIGVRRMIGVSVLAYGLLHLGLYMAQENWNLVKVASEIVLRIYLTIGFVALLGLAALGVTSFDRAVRRLGPAWNRLHQLAYPIAALGILHFFLQSKSDVAQPTIMAGLFVLLMLYRLAVRSGLQISSWWVLLACAGLAAVATSGLEYVWYALATGIPAQLVFLANFDVATSFRPAVWVALAGAAVSLAAAGQQIWQSVRKA
ncbi:protein-methionine-sulfoxide reductase heme-binding subunit MsrQ [Roseibium polysiphoniae]|uniref:sulfite oxidase heme-binding subunit YedZ n=1 Tax=Roseibium polysiphoniae TaxID=2571221 RepID=UPI002594819B|nr:protein-methionine-sulfoxide reductase heme-binding subunit MsrQ [uncultured Roseibium sp.]